MKTVAKTEGRTGIRRRKKAPKSTRSSIIELVVIIAIALGLAFLIQAFVIKPYRIPSGSMEPTLAIGQRVLVNRIGMDFSDPHVGQIVVFHPPLHAEQAQCGLPRTPDAVCATPVPREDSGTNFIKRVVGGPGDEIKVINGHVLRRPAGKAAFVPEKDSYIKPCQTGEDCNFPTPVKIPPGHWFMMGDNRGESDDSRFWGPVPTGWIVGGAIATYWPPDRIGIL